MALHYLRVCARRERTALLRHVGKVLLLLIEHHLLLLLIRLAPLLLAGSRIELRAAVKAAVATLEHGCCVVVVVTVENNVAAIYAGRSIPVGQVEWKSALLE